MLPIAIDRACVAEASRDLQLTVRAHATPEASPRNRPAIVPVPAPIEPVDDSAAKAETDQDDVVGKMPDPIGRERLRSTAAANSRGVVRTIT